MSQPIYVTGIKGEAVHGSYQSSYPVHVMSNESDATEMRFGNTLEEMLESPWRPYNGIARHYIRTGNGARHVFVQFMHPTDVVTSHVVVVDPFNSPLGKAYEFPAVYPKSDTAFYWKQDFAEWFEHWVGYTFDPAGPNIFYPATWFPDGGVDNAPFIRVDASRWNNDTPESPNSVLMLVTYFEWITGEEVTDLAWRKFKFHLRGVNLNLYGGVLGNWFVDGPADGVSGGRFWKTQNTAAVVAPDGEWSAEQEVEYGSTVDWTQSYGVSHAPLTDRVRSIGIGARGYSKVPTGAIDLCKVRIV